MRTALRRCSSPLLPRADWRRLWQREQRVKIIEFYRPKDWTILYCDVPCCGPKVLPTFPAVYHQLGPALPGFYRAEDQMYWLSYPGVTFMFPISRDFAHMFRDERHFNMVLPC